MRPNTPTKAKTAYAIVYTEQSEPQVRTWALEVPETKQSRTDVQLKLETLERVRMLFFGLEWQHHSALKI